MQDNLITWSYNNINQLEVLMNIGVVIKLAFYLPHFWETVSQYLSKKTLVLNLYVILFILLVETSLTRP